jgi:hypothetical protein
MVPIERKSGRASEGVWKFRRQISFSHPGFEPWALQPVAWLVYWLDSRGITFGWQLAFCFKFNGRKSYGCNLKYFHVLILRERYKWGKHQSNRYVGRVSSLGPLGWKSEASLLEPEFWIILIFAFNESKTLKTVISATDLPLLKLLKIRDTCYSNVHLQNETRITLEVASIKLCT